LLVMRRLVLLWMWKIVLLLLLLLRLLQMVLSRILSAGIGGGLALVVLVHDGGRFLAVDAHVLFEVSGLAESFAANVANVGSFARVKSRVNYHLVALCERLGAKLASVRPGVCVNSLVFSHQIAPLKAFWAIGALERTLAGVSDPGVQHHFAAASESRAALLADERFLAGVDSPVLLHVALLRKTLAAKVARVGLEPRVNPQMRVQVRSLSKPFSA